MTLPKPVVLPGDTARQVERHRETNWSDFDARKRAFAVAFIQNQCCHRKAATEMGLNPDSGSRYMRDPLTRALIQDLLTEIEAFSVTSEAFLREKLMELYEKTVGNEKTPQVLGSGATFEAHRFYPGESRAILELLAKMNGNIKRNDTANKDENPTINLNFGNVMTHMESDEQGNVTIDVTPMED